MTNNPWNEIAEPEDMIRRARNMVELHKGFAWAAVMERTADMFEIALRRLRELGEPVEFMDWGAQPRQEPPKPAPAVSARRKPPRPPAATQDPPRRKPGSLFNT